MNPSYRIKVYDREYVKRMKDILFDLFEKNTGGKFKYDREELNEEKMIKLSNYPNHTPKNMIE
nr:hypothetical protein [Mycoplasmopsis bovis]